MKKAIKRLIPYLKGLLLLMRPHVLFGWLRHPFLSASNILALTKWIAAQDKKDILNDFYSLHREYHKRFELYQHVVGKLDIESESIDYLEFGVFDGHSFKWWLANCTNPENRFYGFDTFEGLPENWGTFNKGDMYANIPVVNDSRAEFIKGLFQDTVPKFLKATDFKTDRRKIVHLDADLFSSTLFALTSLGPHLKKGDILIFDEFNVPNHEFFAFKIFSESYYVKTKLIAAVNNYYQVALIII